MNFVLPSRLLKGVICLSLGAAVCGCSLMAKKQAEYVGVHTLPPLKVPPGLSNPPPDQETHIPPLPGTQGSVPPARTLAAPPIVALESSDIQLQSDGPLNWLVIRESREDARRQIRDFWERDGIAVAYDDARVGVMETAWRTEETANHAGDNTATPETAVQTKFRVRLEHYADTGGTEVFISCRSRKRGPGDRVQWVPLPDDPVLEADMMNKLLAFLGGDASGTQMVTIKAPLQGFVKRIDDGAAGPTLLLDKPLDMAWRHVGQAVDRLGYAIVAQDRPDHKYMITLGGHPPEVAKKAGWLSRLFFNKQNSPTVPVYSVNLTAGKDSGTVVIAAINPGTGADPDQTSKILDQIAGELR